jgi:hypothetical protein
VRPADAYLVSIPYPSFTNGQIIDANKENANNAALSGVINGGIEHVNMGPNGIYATDIIPTSASQASFGGTYPYTFPAGIIENGTVQLLGSNVGVGATITQMYQDASSNLALNVASGKIYAFHVNGAQVAYIGETGAQFAGLNVTGLGASLPVCTDGAKNLTTVGCGGGVGSIAATPPITASGTTSVTIACGACVTGVTGTGNIASTGGTTPQISITSSPTFTSVGATTLSASSYITGSQFEAGGHGVAGVPIFGPSGASIEIGCNGSSQNCPVYWYTAGTGSASVAHLDNAGNFTAANYFTGSRREWKYDIRPLDVDAVRALEHLAIRRYRCRTKQCGPYGMRKIGYIANDAPSDLSGPNHDHADPMALATYDAAAIVQQAAEIRALKKRVAELERAHR